TNLTEPWSKNSTNKRAVFVILPAEKVITDANGKYPNSLISQQNLSDHYCVGYICPNGPNDEYGNPDGSCDTTPPAPDPVDPSPVPDDDTVNPPAPTPTTNDGPHKNTVQPYLDALKTKCKK
ncbi:MAG: hypothetical protein IJU89_02035, partial [Alphaproteobacteria bacterium]|nr:hypothetical protein [Alphaproteobacteria bacterium]